MEIEIQLHRLEQQLASYEKLHVEELQRFQAQFAAFQRVQSDEMQMLREQVRQFKEELAQLKAEPPANADPNAPRIPTPPPVDLTITRRDFLTGNLAPSQKHV